MLKSKLTLLLTPFLLTICLTSCLKDQCSETRTFFQFDPIFMSLDDIRSPIATEQARTLKVPGKMYFHNDLIYINEIREGVHIIDNADPENPQNIGFIPIPGNADIAIKDNIMYADSYIDVVSVDVSNPMEASLIAREESVFENTFQITDNGLIVGFEETENRIEVECSDPRFGDSFFWGDDSDIFVNAEVSGGGFDPAGGIPTGAPGGTTGGNVGIGGSLARFTITKDHLYTLETFRLQTFQIESNGTLELLDNQNVWDAETIFPSGDELFIGTMSGMLIYSIENPSMPVRISEFTHAQACDPVFVDGDRAYVTLRDGTECQNFINQLDVVNISDITNPSLIVTHEMENPHGLSKFDDILYICEGQHGLKVFDASDDLAIGNNQLDHIDDMFAFDVISLSDNHILVIGEDGLYQFDTTDKSNVKTLSFMNIER